MTFDFRPLTIMPSGKTHDLITFIISVPTFFISYFFTKNFTLGLIVSAATVFGGLMFGPDLDTFSLQYKRWGPLRILWWPYKVAFSHRSRFSHGIVLGTLIRIAYFLIMAALVTALGLYVRGLLQGSAPNGEQIVFTASERVANFFLHFDRSILAAVVVGLWWGAASHTIVDFTVTTVKQIFKLL